jgi:hypothetical protein
MIRNLTIQDLPELADLRMNAGGNSAQKKRTQVAFSQLYPQLLFDTPWFDPNIPSLVSTDSSGRLNGMLAVGARPMLFKDRTITAAIGADMHVPKEARSTMAGVALLKELFNGPQDVTICDIANHNTRRLWERLGGFVAPAYNINWIGILRPLQLAGSLLRERRGLGLAGRAAMVAAPLIDGSVCRRFRCRIDPMSRGVVAETLTTDHFSEHLLELTRDDSVQPIYSTESAEWMWKRLSYLSPDSGEVSAVIMRNSRGKLLGWYIYTLSPGGVARVAQIAARQVNAAVVVRHLFARAFDEGACAVAGRMQPRFQQVLIDQACVLRGRGTYTLVHSRDEAIASAFRSGTAWLSVLDGESPLNVWNSPEAATAELSTLPPYARPIGIADTPAVEHSGC